MSLNNTKCFVPVFKIKEKGLIDSLGFCLRKMLKQHSTSC